MVGSQWPFLPRGRALPDAVWQARHRWMVWLLMAHMPALAGFALVRGYGLGHAAVEVFPLLVATLVARTTTLSRGTRSLATSLGLVVGASVLVHLAGGSIEAHFQFFVVIAFLSLYQAWRPFLLALGYVVAEHGILGTLHPESVYNNPANVARPWVWALIHGGFVLAASVANMLAWSIAEHEALHDELTGLPNRASLLEHLTRRLRLRDPARLATVLVFIDLDDFKDANDAFGHDVGDQMLRETARRLLRASRAGDLVARLGGDEFAVVLSAADDDTATRRAAELLRAVTGPRAPGAPLSPRSASAGFARALPEVSSPSDLLRRADLAMYEAKRAGKNRAHGFTPSLQEQVLRRSALEHDLRLALDRGELVVHYQPVVELRGRRVVGAEALVRWQHPDCGLLAPAEFLETAERCGFMGSLGEQVLREACAQAAEWRSRHPALRDFTVSVNLAAAQLREVDLVSRVGSILRDTGLPPAGLCLEITESAVIDDLEASLRVLTELRALGISLALDDFGTGFSSLSHLQQLPVTSVKIDRSFVERLADSRSASIVGSVVSLAHTLGLEVTAEGAESEPQLQLLAELGSDHAQGYVIGRPVAARTFEALLPDLGLATATVPRQRRATEPATRLVS